MLPPTCKALVQEVYGEPLVVKSITTPQPTPGSVVIQILCAPIISYMRDVYNGKRKYTYPTPIVTGSSAIGRVAATGPDAVLLKEGDLVYFDCTVRGRDDDQAIILMGMTNGSSAASRRLMDGEWRDSTFAEYAKVPLENAFVLDEGKLCAAPEQGGLGYTLGQLTWMLQALVPYGGLRSINIEAGQTIIVAPGTGGFGSAAVVVALAMGAKVIAMGRNEEQLSRLRSLSSKVHTVRMTGDLESEMQALKSFGNIDAYFDISPREAQDSTHFKAAILSLRHGAKVSLMGGFQEDVKIPHKFIMRHDITLKGKWMYSREDNIAFLRMLENGCFDLGKFVKVLASFKLEEWEKALEVGTEAGRLGEMVVFTPSTSGM